MPGEFSTTEPDVGTNSNSPVVASGVLKVNVMPAQAVPVLPLAVAPPPAPLARKTPGSACPARQGAVSSPHEGVWRIKLNVREPPLSGVVEVFVMLKATMTLVSPTTTIAG